MVRRWRMRSTMRLLRLTDLASITERRIDRLLNPDINEGLPAFLSPDAGLSSGFMIAQIVAAALINECQVLGASFVDGKHSHRRRQGRSRVDGHDRER
jgi:histidine ammonia-lyase